MRVLHVIREVTRGGGTLGMLQQSLAASARGVALGARVEHSVLSLRAPSDPAAVEHFARCGIPVVSGAAWEEEVRRSDVVQLEWWNNPEINQFVLNTDLPACCILLHSRAHFDAPWMCPSVELLHRVDHCTVTTPSAAANPTFERNRCEAGLPPAGCVFSTAAEVYDAGPRPHDQREVVFGYLGTVEPIKLHPRFLELAGRVLSEVPDATFRFAGEGTLDEYARAAAGAGLGGRVSFDGFVSDVAGFFGGVDIFFYPINKYTYATSEKVLQEAMLAELPCVVFPHGGIRDVVTADSARVSADEDSFVRNCVELARSRPLREELGRRARRAMEELPVRLTSPRDFLVAWETTMGRPRRPRRARGVSRAGLMEYAADASALRPERLTEQDFADCRLVSAFVEDAHRVWAGGV
jgi:glycosyltransferase involved in cell wall biosynthesis